MKFKEAFEFMKGGEAMKLPEWRGFWSYDPDAETIWMHCHDGKKLDLRKTEDLGFTLGNVSRDDWELANPGNCPVLVGEYDFDFAEAIRHVKNGEKVCRKGWNGKGQFIELASCISYETESGFTNVNVEHDNTGNKAIAFVGTSGVQIGWLASQADMLADDWTFHECEIVVR